MGRLCRTGPVLAISSGGGHWVELLRLRPAWQAHDVVYATVKADHRTEVGSAPFFVVPDANRHTKRLLIKTCAATFLVLIKVRPSAVVSTGAAPGFFALFFGKLMGAKTVWIDSIANAEELSLSGKLVRPFADVWLTQWEFLASPKGPYYRGSVL